MLPTCCPSSGCVISSSGSRALLGTKSYFRYAPVRRACAVSHLNTQPSRTREEWEELGAQAILDLLGDKFAAPWAEIEARIAVRGWKHFDTIQPVQLSGARRRLRDEGLIIEEESNHAPSPVRMIRLPYTEGSKREQERLLGRRRKVYRKFLSWTADSRLCGKHAERVVLSSLQHAASDAGLYVPQQSVGEIDAINGVDLSGSPLDCWAHVLDMQSIDRAAVALFEVKNVHEWIYPDSRELWQLLVSVAPAAAHLRVVPVLVCVRYAFPVQNMAMDLGFLLCALRDQVFNPTIDGCEFDEVAEEFGLLMIQHEGPLEPVTSFMTKIFRRPPPFSKPVEDVEWFRRQADRFAKIAPVIAAHAALAEALSPEARRNVFKSFATRATAAAGREAKARLKLCEARGLLRLTLTGVRERSRMASDRVRCRSFDRVSVPTSRPKEAVMHAVVRSYSGQGASELFEQLEQRNEEVKGIIGGVPGFVSYTAFRSSEGGVTVTVCQDKTGTDESSRRAAEWVKENISAMADPPVITEGSTVIHFNS